MNIYFLIRFFIIVGILAYLLYFIFTTKNLRFLFAKRKQKKDCILIQDGKINLIELLNQDYSLRTLMRELHQANVKHLEEVAVAILKKDKTLSIILKNKPTPYQETLVIEGNIVFDTLVKIGKNEQWLNDILKEKNLTLKDIFLAYYRKEQLVIICND